MTLPKIKRPIYKYELPVSKKKVKIHPYVLKHHKLLLMALEGEDNEQILLHTKEVIKDCLHEDSKELDLDTLPFVDFEYLFLKLRCISLDNTTPVNAICTHCNHSNAEDINLDEIKINIKEKYESIIKLPEDITLELSYPSLDKIMVYNELIKHLPSELINYYSIYTYVKNIKQKGEELEFTKEEFIDWISELDVKNFQHLNEIIFDIPKLYYENTMKCKNCSEDFNVKVTGFTNFFIS